MRIALLLLPVFLLASASAQEMPCITSVKPALFDKQGVLKRPLAPAAIKRHLPTDAEVQLVIPMSSSETLTIYEAGESFDPDTRLVLTRTGRVLARFAIKDLPDDHEWGRSLRAMGAVHLCANGQNITYIVLQTGNQGGYLAALAGRSDGFHLVEIEAVQQGRLIISVNDPSRIVIWSVAREDASDCTGCPKHYVVKTAQFDGKSFTIIEKNKTKKKYNSFQDEPLVVVR